MKKIATITLSTLVASFAFAQGTVNFITPTGMFVTNSATSARAAAGTTFKAALYYAPDTGGTDAPAFGSFIQLGAAAGFGGAAGNPALAGRINDGLRTTTATPGGNTAWFQIRAWESAFGDTFETASLPPQALRGVSNMIKLGTGNPTGTPSVPAPTSLAGMTSFLLVPVPEPGAIALGLVGLGALLALRRRK